MFRYTYSDPVFRHFRGIEKVPEASVGGITHEARKLAQYALETMRRGNLGQYRVTGYLEDYGAWLAVMVIGNLWPPIVMAQVVLDREIEELQPTPFPGGLFLLFDTWVIEASPKFKSAQPLDAVGTWTIEEKPSLIPDGIRFASNCCSNPAEAERVDYVASLLRTLPDPANNIEGGRTYFCGPGGMPLFDLTEIFGLKLDGYNIDGAPDDRYCYPMWIDGKACIAIELYSPYRVAGYVMGVPDPAAIEPPVIDPATVTTIPSASLSNYANLDLDHTLIGSGIFGNANHYGDWSFTSNSNYTIFSIVEGESDSLAATIVPFTKEATPARPANTDTGYVKTSDCPGVNGITSSFPEQLITQTFEYDCWDPPTPVDWNATVQRSCWTPDGSRAEEKGMFEHYRNIKGNIPYSKWVRGTILEKDTDTPEPVYGEQEYSGTHQYLSKTSASTSFIVTALNWIKGACSALLGRSDAVFSVQTNNPPYVVTRTVTVNTPDLSRTTYKDTELLYRGSLQFYMQLKEVHNFPAKNKTTNRSYTTTSTPYDITINISQDGDRGGFITSPVGTYEKTKAVTATDLYHNDVWQTLDTDTMLMCYSTDQRPIIGPAWPTTTFVNLYYTNLFLSALSNAASTSSSERIRSYVVSIDNIPVEDVPLADPANYEYLDAYLLTPATIDKACVFFARSVKEDEITSDYVYEYALFGYYDGTVTNLSSFLDGAPGLREAIEAHIHGWDYYTPAFGSYDWFRPYDYRPGIALRAKANV